MSELRCPMCSAENTASAQACAECGARLTPLIAGEDHSGEHFEPDKGSQAEEPVSEGEDWLARFRREVDVDPQEEIEESPDLDAGESPDWLGDLRQADTDYGKGPPEGDEPEWMDEFIAAADDEHAEQEQGEEVPDWLARIREKTQSPEGSTDEPDDDWITSLRQGDEDEQIHRPSGLEDLVPAPEEDEPESELPQSAPLDLGALSSVPPPDRPSGEWERSVADGVGEAEGQADAGVPADFSPESIREDEGDGEPDLTHVPALVPEDSAEAPIIEIDETVFDSAELPGWLEQIKPALDALEKEEAAFSEEASSEEDVDLAPATLPSWLEAMRPVDAFRPEIDIEPDEEQPVESAGPLAGLRGVLMAEPVVAKPRTSSASASRLEVTERQYAQAELLQRLVEQESREVKAGPERPFTLPIARWLISLMLLIAMLLPYGFDQIGIEGFGTPSVVSPDLPPLISLVNEVPVDRPALIVFDYTSGYSGELDTVAGSLIRHLAIRGVPMVTLSTRVTGPPLADRLMREVFGEGAGSGEDYLHLGFLSGGPTAIQLFSISPRDAILTGFELPEGLRREDVWASPLLHGINRLSDFGLVTVITAGTETARTWAEQTHPWIGDAPLVMVLSAGTEPLVRPYFESLDRQVDGILSGLPSAIAYQQTSGQETTALQGWDSFGSGLLTVEIILLAGMGYGLFRWLVERRSR